MTKKNQLLAAIMCLALLGNITACGGNQTSSPSASSGQPAGAGSPAKQEDSGGFNMTIKLGCLGAATEPALVAANSFADEVKEKTNGRIVVNVFPSATIGSELEMIESMQNGTLEMALINSATLTNFTDAYDVGLLPFLFADRNEAYKVYDSEIGDGMLAALSDIGLKGLTHMENGMRYIINNKKEVVHPADLKGLKIRTMESEWHLKAFEAMGANPTPMAWGDVYTSLQQGVIDGCEIPLTSITDYKIYEICDYITMTGHFYCPYVAIMSQSIWDTIPQEDQAIIQEAIVNARDYQRELCGEKDGEALDLLRKEISVAEDIELGEWRETIQPVYDEFSKVHGGGQLAQIQDMLK